MMFVCKNRCAARSDNSITGVALVTGSSLSRSSFTGTSEGIGPTPLDPVMVR
jgi:hypothetical protein